MACVKNTVVIFLASILLGGCATKLLPTEYEAKEPGTLQTLPIALISDTQFHENRGVPSLWFSKAGDEFVPVTIRTAQQVAGQSDVLVKTLAQTKDHRLVLHLGDAIDVSCETEWEEFSKAMSRRGRDPAGAKDWYFTPGNHDGYMVGNLFPEPTGFYRENYWANVCNAGQVWVGDKPRHANISRNVVLQSYLRSLGRNPDSSGGCAADKSYCWAARLALPDRPWLSYLVQLIQLPAAPGATHPVYVLMLDSGNYSERPYFLPTWAGVRGDFSHEQLEAGRALLAKMPQGARFFVAAHHEVSSWDPRTWSQDLRPAWKGIIGHPQSLRFIVTAHTHRGGWYKHTFDHADFLELNLGSLIDWPLYYRTLEFSIDSSGQYAVQTPPVQMQALPPQCKAKLPCELESEPSLSCSVEKQAPASVRVPTWRFWAGLGSAINYLMKLYSSKEDELNPQMLVYADIVEATMPAGHRFTYEPSGIPPGDGTSGKRTYSKEELVKQMRYMASTCTDSKECGSQFKGNLLKGLHEYYWDDSTPDKVRTEAHELRYCAAVRASEDSRLLERGGAKRTSEVTTDSERTTALLPGGRVTPVAK